MQTYFACTTSLTTPKLNLLLLISSKRRLVTTWSNCLRFNYNQIKFTVMQFSGLKTLKSSSKFPKSFATSHSKANHAEDYLIRAIYSVSMRPMYRRSPFQSQIYLSVLHPRTLKNFSSRMVKSSLARFLSTKTTAPLARVWFTLKIPLALQELFQILKIDLKLLVSSSQSKTRTA
jgi:hypothetical protein